MIYLNILFTFLGTLIGFACMHNEKNKTLLSKLFGVLGYTMYGFVSSILYQVAILIAILTLYIKISPNNLKKFLDKYQEKNKCSIKIIGHYLFSILCAIVFNCLIYPVLIIKIAWILVSNNKEEIIKNNKHDNKTNT